MRQPLVGKNSSRLRLINRKAISVLPDSFKPNIRIGIDLHFYNNIDKENVMKTANKKYSYSFSNDRRQCLKQFPIFLNVHNNHVNDEK